MNAIRDRALTSLIQGMTSPAADQLCNLSEGTGSMIPCEQDRMKQSSRKVIGLSTAAGVFVSAVSFIPLGDAVVLSAIEAVEVLSLAKIYGINKKNKAQFLIARLIEIGIVSAAARAVCAALLRLIPFAGHLVNIAVAGCFVAGIGEGARHIFEQISLGNKSADDLDWAEKALKDNLSGRVPVNTQPAAGQE